MSESRDRILTEYRCAGFYRRMQMYLQFRELRSQFILIDRNELNVGFSAMLKSPGEGHNGVKSH
jgi:hypothetical protein